MPGAGRGQEVLQTGEVRPQHGGVAPHDVTGRQQLQAGRGVLARVAAHQLTGTRRWHQQGNIVTNNIVYSGAWCANSWPCLMRFLNSGVDLLSRIIQ